MLKAIPFFGTLYETFTNAVARPSKVTGAKYNQVSAEFCNAAHEVLAGRAKAETAWPGSRASSTRLSRGGQLVGGARGQTATAEALAVAATGAAAGPRA